MSLSHGPASHDKSDRYFLYLRYPSPNVGESNWCERLGRLIKPSTPVKQ